MVVVGYFILGDVLLRFAAVDSREGGGSEGGGREGSGREGGSGSGLGTGALCD